MRSLLVAPPMPVHRAAQPTLPPEDDIVETDGTVHSADARVYRCPVWAVVSAYPDQLSEVEFQEVVWAIDLGFWLVLDRNRPLWAAPAAMRAAATTRPRAFLLRLLRACDCVYPVVLGKVAGCIGFEDWLFISISLSVSNRVFDLFNEC